MRKCCPLYLILVCILFCVAPTWGEDQFLVRATNDQDSSVDNLSLRLDGQGRLTHLLHIPSGRSEIAYKPAELKRGVVLREKSGRELIVLKMQQFSPERGATVVLTYLYRAVPMESYRTLKLKLVHDNGEWALRDSKGGKVASMHIKANIASVLGYSQPVGIQKLVLKSKK
jgi:hypothetical protein